MMEISPPDVGQYDTSKTYHLGELKYTSRKFTSIKDRLRVSQRTNTSTIKSSSKFVICVVNFHSPAPRRLT